MPFFSEKKKKFSSRTPVFLYSFRVQRHSTQRRTFKKAISFHDEQTIWKWRISTARLAIKYSSLKSLDAFKFNSNCTLQLRDWRGILGEREREREKKISKVSDRWPRSSVAAVRASGWIEAVSASKIFFWGTKIADAAILGSGDAFQIEKYLWHWVYIARINFTVYTGAHINPV